MKIAYIHKSTKNVNNLLLLIMINTIPSLNWLKLCISKKESTTWNVKKNLLKYNLDFLNCSASQDNPRKTQEYTVVLKLFSTNKITLGFLKVSKW